jgi:hypothetical protein
MEFESLQILAFYAILLITPFVLCESFIGRLSLDFRGSRCGCSDRDWSQEAPGRGTHARSKFDAAAQSSSGNLIG